MKMKKTRCDIVNILSVSSLAINSLLGVHLIDWE